mgnify:CR=1 FL=1
MNPVEYEQKQPKDFDVIIADDGSGQRPESATSGDLRPASTQLERIERYNRDDVVSTARLRDWLEARRDELAGLVGEPVPRPAPRVAELPADLTATQARVQALVARLADPAVVPTDIAERSPEQHARWLLAQLLGWHRREDKSMWWDFHRLMDLTPEQLAERLAGLGAVAEQSSDARIELFVHAKVDVGHRGCLLERRSVRRALPWPPRGTVRSFARGPGPWSSSDEAESPPSPARPR